MLSVGDISDLLVAALLLAPASYVSTNLDNLLILSALLSQSASRAIVAAGFLMGNLATLLADCSGHPYVVQSGHIRALDCRGEHLAWGSPDYVRQQRGYDGGLWPAFRRKPGAYVSGPGPGIHRRQPGRSPDGATGAELSERVERVGPRLVPWVMIGVGLYVLANSTTDLV